MLIEVATIVVGRGPCPLTVAKMLAGQAVPCLLAGHEPVGGDELVPLDDAAVAALERHRLLDILVPSMVAGPPLAISPNDFEDVLKHHCVADINVTVYDGVEVVDRQRTREGVRAVLTLGRARWDLRARWLIEGENLPASLPEAIVAAEQLVDGIVAELASGGPRSDHG